MEISLFQAANLILVVLLGVLLIRFLISLILSSAAHPSAWKEARKAGKISLSLIRQERQFSDKVRFFTWWMQVERMKREEIPGDFAEVGVYRGTSARILHRMDPDREFHLFDTFEGFPACDLEGETGEAATYTSRHFADTGLARVRKIGMTPGKIFLYPGYFPDTASDVAGRRFALVNLDADLYRPTLAGLRFFYPRVYSGGVIFIHDYTGKWTGIIRAVDEFCREIPERLLHIPDREGTVMILKG